MTRMDAKRKLLVVLFALYVTFIIISTIPYLAEQNLIRTRAPKDDYVSHLTFPADGEYDHYKNVVLLDKKSIGIIDLKYTFETNAVENLSGLIKKISNSGKYLLLEEKHAINMDNIISIDIVTEEKQ